MQVIKINDNRTFNKEAVVVGYFEENKVEKLQFSIPAEWQSYGRKACFEASGTRFTKTFDNITDDTITLTRDITQFRELEMSIAFFKVENDDEIIARTSILNLIIENSIVADDDIEPDDPKVVVLDELIQKVDDLNNQITVDEENRQKNEVNREKQEAEREAYFEELKKSIDSGHFVTNPLENKNVCVLGDSLSYGYGAIKSWATFLQERTNCNMVNLAVSGAGLTAYCPNKVADQVPNIPNNADIIVLFCGGNDFWFSSPIDEYESELHSFINSVVNAHPTSEVLYVSMPDVTIENTVHSDIFKYINSTLKVCFDHSIPCINLYSAMGTTPRNSAQYEAYYADTVHFNTAGQERLSKVLQKYIEDASINNNYNFVSDTEPSAGAIIKDIDDLFDNTFNQTTSSGGLQATRDKPNYNISSKTAGVWNLSTGEFGDTVANVNAYSGSSFNLWFACDNTVYFDMTDYQPNETNNSAVVITTTSGKKTMYYKNKTGNDLIFNGIMIFTEENVSNFNISVTKLQITKEVNDETWNGYKMQICTQEEYNNSTKDSDTFYFITES